MSTSFTVVQATRCVHSVGGKRNVAPVPGIRVGPGGPRFLLGEEQPSSLDVYQPAGQTIVHYMFFLRGSPDSALLQCTTAVFDPNPILDQLVGGMQLRATLSSDGRSLML